MFVIATTSCLQYLFTEAMAGLFKCVKRASDAKPSRLSACAKCIKVADGFRFQAMFAKGTLPPKKV